MKNKIICIFVSLIILVSVLCVPVSAAGNYTEYYEYSGQAISSTVANTLEGYAFNYLRYRNPSSGDKYNYWCAFRISQYQYLILCGVDYSDFVFDYIKFTVRLNNGIGIIYDEHLHSYNDGNRVVYQAGLKNGDYITAPITIQLTRGYVIGNLYNTTAVNPEHETVFNLKYIPYILYTLIFFLLLFVAFKFLNKRWLLP